MVVYFQQLKAENYWNCSQKRGFLEALVDLNRCSVGRRFFSVIFIRKLVHVVAVQRRVCPRFVFEALKTLVFCIL